MEFVEWMTQAHPGITSIDGISPLIAREYWGHLNSIPFAPATRYDILKLFRSLFRALADVNLIEKKAFDGIKSPSRKNIPHRPFTPDELAIIKANASHWRKWLLQTAYYEGLREGDICMLHRDNVNLEEEWIRKHMGKTAEEVLLPLHPRVTECIREAASESHEGEVREYAERGYVYPLLAWRYQNYRSRIGKDITRWLREIGITGITIQPPGYQRAINQKGVHSLRHTHAYIAAISGMPLLMVQDQLGHTSSTMTDVYVRHAGLKERQQYMARFPELL